MTSKCISKMNYIEMLEELSHNSLRAFCKAHYTYYAEVAGILARKDINLRVLKNHITPEQIHMFQGLGIGLNKIALLSGVSVSTLKRIRARGSPISSDNACNDKEHLQKCIDLLRKKGYTKEEIAEIFCSYSPKMKKDFRFDELENIDFTKSEAERRMLKKSYILGNLYSVLFEEGDGND